MTIATDSRRPDLEAGPLDMVRAWPIDEPVALLHSGGAGGDGTERSPWSRWSIIAVPRGYSRFDGRWVSTGDAPRVCESIAGHALRGLDALQNAAAQRLCSEAPRRPDPPDRLPFAGGWIGAISYDLGSVIEPTARAPARREAGAAGETLDGTAAADGLIELAWCPAALVFDHHRSHWRGVGDRLEVERLWRAAHTALERPPARRGRFAAGPVRAAASPAAYEAIVARAIGYIAAGDIFQANLAHWFEAEMRASRGGMRAFAARALARSGAWYGAHIELAKRGTDTGPMAILSMSPELFLQLDPARREIVTRPIKGTRPRATDRRELERSEKDTAELNMIVDLMRNDLGRVCEFGSVRVPRPRMLESHAGVHHGVGEVRGRLLPEISIGDLIGATFPPGSVTGAPKIRAMQIINELEGRRRGPYCGAIGFLSACGAATLSVGIRTAILDAGRIRYAAGAGIVADSTPAGELRETLAKTAPLLAALRARASRRDAGSRRAAITSRT
jgi:anthranilate/para-aminobenzoate synthase component I